MSKQPPPAPTASVVGPCPTVIQISRTPRHWRFTQHHCSELYNYESYGDNAVLDCSQPPEEDLQPILREEVAIAIVSMKKGKSAGVDNIPAELVQAGG